ncbi:hypothetical protein WJX82_004076 [Trebouxia sp. C0006]
MSAKPEEQSAKKQYGGWNKQYQHHSKTLGCDMKFSVFTPPAADKQKVPVLYFLSGLTCDDQTFIVKSNAQRKASEHGIALVTCDTSPRGLNIDGEEEDWDFGTGAGFYLNATKSKWKQYRMYDYVVKELPEVLQSLAGLDVHKASVFGHSMGGHGALTIFLKNADVYKSVSAYAPICNPINVQWGQKAFSGYLGDDQSTWKQYDATELVKQYKGPKVPVLIDIGTLDNFKDKQLSPEAFQKAAEGKLDVQLRLQDGYDHSYFTISTFIDDHINHHAKALCKM